MFRVTNVKPMSNPRIIAFIKTCHGPCFEQGLFEGKAEETTTASKYEHQGQCLAKLVNFTRLRVPIVGDKTHQALAVYHFNPL